MLTRNRDYVSNDHRGINKNDRTSTCNSACSAKLDSNKYSQIDRKKNHDSRNKKINQNSRPPSNSSTSGRGVNTSTKQSMTYVTVSGITQRTNITQQDFPIFCLKELLDNASDFLDSNYSDSKDARIIMVRIKIENEILHIVVRNSNDYNLVPFVDLASVFDFDRFYSTKRNQHRISRGALGDALKEILAMGYALMNSTDKGDSFTDKQWDEPLILRYNGREHRIYIHVDKADERITTRIDDLRLGAEQIDGDANYIEVEVALPIPDSEGYDLLHRLKQYCKKYTLFRNKKTDYRFDWDDRIK